MKSHFLGFLMVLMVACGGDDSGGAVDAAPPDASANASPDAASYEFDQNGCLTFGSASDLCGFGSDDSACALQLSCHGGDDGQCKINCEMGTTVKCYKQADVDCLAHAVAAHDCAALDACAWIL